MKPLLAEHETTGRQYADGFAHRLRIVMEQEGKVQLLDTAHPSVSDDLEIADQGNPYLWVTEQEIDDEIQSMTQDDELVAGSSEELTRVRAIIRVLLEREELPDQFMSEKEAIKDAWENDGENIAISDGYNIICPDCFTLLPKSRICECTS